MSDILIMITTTLANYSFKLRQSPYEILKHCFYLAHPLSIICKVFYSEKKKSEMNTQKSSTSIRALKLQFFRLIMLYTSRKLNNELILLNFYSVIDLSLLHI